MAKNYYEGIKKTGHELQEFARMSWPQTCLPADRLHRFAQIKNIKKNRGNPCNPWQKIITKE